MEAKVWKFRHQIKETKAKSSSLPSQNDLYVVESLLIEGFQRKFNKWFFLKKSLETKIFKVWVWILIHLRFSRPFLIFFYVSWVKDQFLPWPVVKKIGETQDGISILDLLLSVLVPGCLCYVFEVFFPSHLIPIWRILVFRVDSGNSDEVFEISVMVNVRVNAGCDGIFFSIERDCNPPGVNASFYMVFFPWSSVLSRWRGFLNRQVTIGGLTGRGSWFDPILQVPSLILIIIDTRLKMGKNGAVRYSIIWFIRKCLIFIPLVLLSKFDVLFPKWPHFGRFYYCGITRWNLNGNVMEKHFFSDPGLSGMNVWLKEDGLFRIFL